MPFSTTLLQPRAVPGIATYVRAKTAPRESELTSQSNFRGAVHGCGALPRWCGVSLLSCGSNDNLDSVQVLGQRELGRGVAMAL